MGGWATTKVKREQALNMIPVCVLKVIAARYNCPHLGSYQIKEFLVRVWDERIHQEVLTQIDCMLRNAQPIERREVVRYKPN